MENEVAIEKLRKNSVRLIEATSLDFKRHLYREIDFDSRLILVRGCRGVGKTTLLLQYLKDSFDNLNSIYLSLDNILFNEIHLSDIIESFYEEGYRFFALDEVHKYYNWSVEVKNLYDSFPEIRLLITSSSALSIFSSTSDLSRRADLYRMQGLSFREFLQFEYKIFIPRFTFQQLLENHIEIAEEYNGAGILSSKFSRYKKRGYYPFYKESPSKYYDRLNQLINQVLEVDLPAIYEMDYSSIRQMKKLLSIVARIAPFSPNIAKLSRDIGIGRERVLLFLDYLEKADIINAMKSNTKSDSAMTKPDKIYLENTNLLHSIGLNIPNSGTERETYAFNALKVNNIVSTPAKGDFMVDNRFVLEIGGKHKNFHQISGIPNSLLVKDGIDVGAKDILPLWILGLLY
jgi:predicted AAA+ superfamily ATPase